MIQQIHFQSNGTNTISHCLYLSPGRYSTNFHTGRLRPEVHPLTLLYIIFLKKVIPFVYSSVWVVFGLSTLYFLLLFLVCYVTDDVFPCPVSYCPHRNWPVGNWLFEQRRLVLSAVKFSLNLPSQIASLLPVVRSSIFRVWFDSWFQAIAPRLGVNAVRKFVLGSSSWRS